MIIFHETIRTALVVKCTMLGTKNIAPSLFFFPVSGPIFCGTVAGGGSVFLPFDKGLNPIKKDGLSLSMITAFFGSTFLHLFLSTSLSNGVIHAKEKAHLLLTLCFITSGLGRTFPSVFSVRNNVFLKKV